MEFLTFGISTGVAIFCVLVYLLLADYTFGVSIGSPPVDKAEVHSVRPQSQNNTFNGYDLNIYNLQKKKKNTISIETRKRWLALKNIQRG